MSLTIFQTKDKDFSLMQTSWANTLNPVINLPTNSGVLLKNIAIVTGTNTINHTLGRKLQGWIVTGMHNAFAQLYDKQSTNQMTDKTLILNSSGITSIDLLVF